VNRKVAGGPPPAPRRHVFRTPRRLVIAFSVVLVGFVSALALQIMGLRQMEATFADMREHEDQMRLALQLEDAVRDRYGHEGRFVLGEAADLAGYEQARARAEELGRELRARVTDPEAVARLKEILRASADLDRLFRDRITPAVRNRDPSAAVTHEQSYRLISLIEDAVGGLFAQLERAATRSRQELVAREEATVWWTAAMLLATPVFVAGAMLYLSRSVARPLARLSRGAAALAAGDLDTRIDVDTPDEFGALAAELNAMTVALKEHQRRLVESEKLAGIGRLASGVAHELNNPLQVMLGYLSLNRDPPDPRLREQLAAVEAEALRCREIVDGLLELTRPAFSVSAAPVDLRRLCEDVSGGLRVSVQPRAVRLSMRGGAVALADRSKLRQVVFNLMKNAVEAAAPEGDVDVLIGASGDSVELTVRDTGPGIAKEARQRVFEPFYTTKPGGTGLGLAVSRAIARAHGGDIDVRNGDSGGAVFTLRLPRALERRL
jgi:signal transduction histidine kinase